MIPEIVLYPAIRPTLKSGDIVTWVGSGLLSRAILHFRPGGSHTSMIVILYGRVFLVEALEHGVSLRLASARFSNYAGDILVHRLDSSTEQQAHMTQIALALVGANLEYGYLTLFKLALGQVRSVMATPVCSQTAAYVLSECGVIPPQAGVVSPGELAALLPQPVRLAPYTLMAEAL